VLTAGQPWTLFAKAAEPDRPVMRALQLQVSNHVATGACGYECATSSCAAHFLCLPAHIHDTNSSNEQRLLMRCSSALLQ
jgi:hypothetical protein